MGSASSRHPASSARRYALKNLPEEIWGKIFSYLPAEDRKNVRLVCRLFFEACFYIPLQQNEHSSIPKIQTMDSASSACPNGPPPNLPEELWQEIFDYLSSEDRKSVRLVCRSLYEASNCIRFQQNEQIVFDSSFDGSIDSVMALRSVSNSARKIWNLKLNNVYLNKDTVLYFFRRTGANIRSLTLNGCEVAPGVLRDIIECCPDLLSISVKFDEWIELNILDVFTGLANDGIVCQSVTSFTLQQNDSGKSTCLLKCKHFLSIFHVFPSIKNLNVIVTVHSCDGTPNLEFVPPDYEFYSTEYLCRSSIYDQVSKMGQQLEKLTLYLDCVSKYDFDRCPTDLSRRLFEIDMENLKELSLNWTCCNWDPEYSLTEDPGVLSKFKYLTDFHCTPSNLQLISLVLMVATKLRSLNVKIYDGYFLIKKDLFHKLVASHLVTLNIYPHRGFLARFDQEEYSSPNSLSPNYTLKHLCVQSDPTASNLLPLLCKYFINLECLVIYNTNESILHNIFNYHMKLQKLVLCNRSFPFPAFRSPLFGKFLAKLPPNREFHCLTHLLIKDDISPNLFDWMLNECRFPRLKSLTIIVTIPSYSNYNMKLFLSSIRKFPLMEYLHIQWNVKTSFTQWFQVFDALPKLHHFRLMTSHSEMVTDSTYRQVFIRRPSLRTFFHIVESSKVCMKYVKDETRNTVTHIPTNLTLTYREFSSYYKNVYASPDLYIYSYD